MSTQNTTDMITSVGPHELQWMCQILTVEGIFGVLGNLFVIFVILRVKFLHCMTNYLLVNLAVADMLSCLQCFVVYLFTPPNCALIVYIPSSAFGREIFCRLVDSRFWSWMCSFLASYSLCMVTWERYVAIVQPLKYPRMLAPTKVVTLIIVMWTVSFLFSLPFLFIKGASEDPNQACTEIEYPDMVFHVSRSVFGFLMAFLLPGALMVRAYYKIHVTLKQQVEALHRQHARAAACDLLIARQRLVYMLTIVLGALIVFWAPGYVIPIICLYSRDYSTLPYYCRTKGFQIVRELTNVLYFLNSVINPIIYELKYKRFQQGVKVAFCSCSGRQRGNRVGIEMATM